MIKKIKNNTESTKVWCGQEIAAGEYYTIQSIEDAVWSNDSTLLTAIGNSEAVVNNGTDDLTDINTGINWLKGTESIRPADGRLNTQDSSRPLGTIITFSSSGDDTTNPTKIGGGQLVELVHDVSDDAVQSIYVDFNVKENRTFIHSGKICWIDAVLDAVCLGVVPKTTAYSSGSDTNYNITSGLIVPAAGNGTVVVNSEDIQLVEMPIGLDYADPKPGFWDADYDSGTHTFSNITPAPYGTGKYNMFPQEICLGTFANRILMIGSNTYDFETQDTQELGHNMRLKFQITTRGDDHAWKAACVLVLYRKNIAVN